MRLSSILLAMMIFSDHPEWSANDPMTESQTPSVIRTIHTPENSREKDLLSHAMPNYRPSPAQ